MELILGRSEIWTLGFVPELVFLPVAQMVKNLPAVQEPWAPSPGWEDPLEKGMATHSSILAWRTPWPEKPGGPQSMGSQRVIHNWVTNPLVLYPCRIAVTPSQVISWLRPLGRDLWSSFLGTQKVELLIWSLNLFLSHPPVNGTHHLPSCSS